jgi:hypothetical protein
MAEDHIHKARAQETQPCQHPNAVASTKNSTAGPSTTASPPTTSDPLAYIAQVITGLRSQLPHDVSMASTAHTQLPQVDSSLVEDNAKELEVATTTLLGKQIVSI